MRYYIADCHFWHTNMIKYMDRRPFQTVEEMNRYMIEKWNSKVRTNDDVVILGDFCVAGAEETNEILRQLNGKHLWLVTGNHDGHFLKSDKFDRRRFIKITPYLELNDEKRKVVCCHYPILEYNGMFRLNENEEQYTWMLFGHIHGTDSNQYIDEYRKIVPQIERPVKLKGKKETKMIHPQAKLINCFCGFSDYTPLTLDEWIQLDAERRKNNERETSSNTSDAAVDTQIQSIEVLYDIVSTIIGRNCCRDIRFDEKKIAKGE